MDPLALGALLFGSGSVLGLWLGHRLQLSREHARWLLDQRVSVYAGYLGALDAYHSAQLAEAIADRSGRASKEVLEQKVATLLAFSNAREKVILLGSGQTIEAVNAIQRDLDRESVSRVSMMAAGEVPPHPTYVDPTRFVSAARRDLKLSAVQDLRSWTPTREDAATK